MNRTQERRRLQRFIEYRTRQQALGINESTPVIYLRIINASNDEDMRAFHQRSRGYEDIIWGRYPNNLIITMRDLVDGNSALEEIMAHNRVFQEDYDGLRERFPEFSGNLNGDDNYMGNPIEDGHSVAVHEWSSLSARVVEWCNNRGDHVDYTRNVGEFSEYFILCEGNRLPMIEAMRDDIEMMFEEEDVEMVEGLQLMSGNDAIDEL